MKHADDLRNLVDDCEARLKASDDERKSQVQSADSLGNQAAAERIGAEEAQRGFARLMNEAEGHLAESQRRELQATKRLIDLEQMIPRLEAALRLTEGNAKEACDQSSMLKMPKNIG